MRGLADRRERLARFGYSLTDSLPVATINVRLACERPECAGIVSAVTHSLKPYRTNKDGLRGLFSKTAAVTDLRLFQGHDDYLRAVSKETAGKYHRAANKARRAGFFVRRIQPGAYAQSLFDIKASKLRRSHGIVPEAVGTGERPQSDNADEYKPPTCSEHWRGDWGLFSESNDRMWGFASLIRAGNVVLMDHMMCHAAVLDAGGMKLLHFEIMSALLGRQDASLAQLDFLVHGAIEDGSMGAADWRRYVHQRPHAIEMSALESIDLPCDFDPEAYLSLNPDVRAAGSDPKKHYLRHGMLEGRPYK